MQIPPTCMCDEELSFVRNETSSADRRSMCAFAMCLTYPRMHRLATALLLCAAFAGCGNSETSASGAQSAFDGQRAFEDLAAQVELGPRPSGTKANAKAAKLIRRGLRDAGAKDIRFQRP